MRSIVDRAIRDHAEIRRWPLFEQNVRTNHLHIVVGPAAGADADEMMKQFKSWGTRRLIQAGLASSTTRVWVDHGSTKHLNSETSLQRAIEYVRNQ
ncbi:MAG: transposase [Phycisphaeraceae bacterium]|nr:transposase [Phycisphaeraceae bacterium]